MDYEKLGAEIGKLVNDKQRAYGDSFGRAGRCLKEMYPDGIRVDQYDDMLTIVRILDKLFRIANQKGAFGESPYRDIAGYGMLGAAVGVRQDDKKGAMQILKPGESPVQSLHEIPFGCDAT